MGLTLIGTIIIMNLVMGWAVQYGPVIGSLAAVGTLLLGTILCFRFIYQYLSKYDYRLIGKELILERAFGRANHVIYTIDLDQISGLVPYKEFSSNIRIKRLHRFVLHKDSNKWFVVSFKEHGQTKNFVFEPNEHFLSGLSSSLSEAL